MPLPEPDEDKSHSHRDQPRKEAGRSKHIWGQHSIEYIILLTLIMVGIIIMGRYVVRSWNANLKGWEDSVEDSLTDTLPEGEITLPGCDANAWKEVECGGNIPNMCTGTDFDCDATEMLWERSYTPIGCQCAVLGAGGVPNPPEFLKCITDDCCCSAPEWTGKCGSEADQPPGNPEPACKVQMDLPKNPDNTCPDGFGEAWVRCGSDADPGGRRYGCIQNDPCAIQCTSPPWPGPEPKYDDFCPGAQSFVPPGGLTITFVDPGQCTGAKCEFECGVGFWAIGNPPALTRCDLCGVSGIEKTGCTVPGTFDFGGCTSPQFKPCCYEE